MALDKRVFLALAAVAWADGVVDPDEADAIVRAAIDSGLDLDDVAEVEAASKAPVKLSSVNMPNMPKEDRIFIYAVACWIAGLDGEMNEREIETIAELGETLGIPEKLRARAEKMVNEIAALPEDRRPARYDLEKLRALIGERLVSPSSSKFGA
jgi:uncharacterized membrane protein YebE (DUF533 family)